MKKLFILSLILSLCTLRMLAQDEAACQAVMAELKTHLNRLSGTDCRIWPGEGKQEGFCADEIDLLKQAVQILIENNCQVGQLTSRAVKIVTK